MVMDEERTIVEGLALFEKYVDYYSNNENIEGRKISKLLYLHYPMCLYEAGFITGKSNYVMNSLFLKKLEPALKRELITLMLDKGKIIPISFNYENSKDKIDWQNWRVSSLMEKEYHRNEFPAYEHYGWQRSSPGEGIFNANKSLPINEILNLELNVNGTLREIPIFIDNKNLNNFDEEYRFRYEVSFPTFLRDIKGPYSLN